MTYIRSKTVRGVEYLYLVRSVWDKEKRTARQKIIKYLGRAAEVVPGDIPVEYSDDPRVLKFLSERAGRGDASGNAADSLYDSLTGGDLPGAVSAFESYTKNHSVVDFFERIFNRVMHDIGARWADGRLAITTEHIASNTARELVSAIRDRTARLEARATVLVCLPPGENHALGCNVIQAFLQGSGFRVLNVSPSAPSRDILDFIQRSGPKAVLISVTTGDNLPAGERLARMVRDEHNIPVVIGGQAVRTKPGRGIEYAGAEPLSKMAARVRRLTG